MKIQMILALFTGLLMTAIPMLAGDGSVTVTATSPAPNPVCSGTPVGFSFTGSATNPTDSACEITITNTVWNWTAVDDVNNTIATNPKGGSSWAFQWVAGGCGTRTITATAEVTFQGTNCNDGSYSTNISGVAAVPVDVITGVNIYRLTFSRNSLFKNDYAQDVPAGSQYWSPSGKTSVLFKNSGTIPMVSAWLTIDCPLSSPATMTITGTATSKAGKTFTFGTKTFQFPAGVLTYTVDDIESQTAFDAKFDFIDHIAWTITYGQCSYQVTTDNNIYYAPDSTPTDKYIDTVLYVVCNAMAGKPYQDSGALDAVWGKFSGNAVQCADRATILAYWKTGTDQNYNTTALLLDQRSGNCEAWSAFLKDCLALAGKTSSVSIRTLRPNDGEFELYVRSLTWSTEGADYGHNEYRYKFKRTSTAVGDCYYGESISGQGGTPCQQYFELHVVIRVGSEYLDPSYGKRKGSALALENEVLDGTEKSFTENQAYLRRKSEYPLENFLSD